MDQSRVLLSILVGSGAVPQSTVDRANDMLDKMLLQLRPTKVSDPMSVEGIMDVAQAREAVQRTTISPPSKSRAKRASTQGFSLAWYHVAHLPECKTINKQSFQARYAHFLRTSPRAASKLRDLFVNQNDARSATVFYAGTQTIRYIRTALGCLVHVEDRVLDTMAAKLLNRMKNAPDIDKLRSIKETGGSRKLYQYILNDKSARITRMMKEAGL